MITVKATLELFAGDGCRRTLFKTGYRPLFDIVEGTLVSGSITLLDRDEMSPGEEADVQIVFLVDDVVPGTIFAFSEGTATLGRGTVKEVVRIEAG